MLNHRYGMVLVLAVTLPTALVVTAQQPQGIFAGSTDVGQTQQGATVYEAASGSYRVTGGGADMWGSADAFHFSWVRLSGDATLTADVHFPAGHLAPLEKAVLIFRQNLDPASAYADVAIHADGHITLQYRVSSGGRTEDITSAEHGSSRLRIERKGNRFTAFTGSGDGQLAAFSAMTVPMEDPVYVGVGVCSHAADGLATVTFSNVAIVSGYVGHVGQHHALPQQFESLARQR
jgi:TolB protein